MRRWAESFPRGTTGFRLARLAGESNTLLRWRKTAGDATAHGRRFELADDADLVVILPATARLRVLEFERCRIQLNYEHALVSYQIQRFTDLQRHHDALARLQRRVLVARRGTETSLVDRR